MTHIIEKIREELKSSRDEKTGILTQKFFKESIQAYGVRNAVVHKIAKENFKSLSSNIKPLVFDHCETLWQSGYLEEAFIACDWSYFVRKQYEPEDFQVFTHWINHYVTNWATCDTLCNHTVGEFLIRYPEYIENLKELTKSSNRWAKRAAAVSLIIPARRGRFLNDILEIADLLLTDHDDMVQKGYGWMLKCASEAHQQIIFDFVVRNKAVMPRTSLRYAIEKMPLEMKTTAMRK